VIVDEQGQPLYPAILWLDERQAAQLPHYPYIGKNYIN
jgi:sugar (pentulose or hexulose) kinase